jgi:hypothetical protein
MIIAKTVHWRKRALERVAGSSKRKERHLCRIALLILAMAEQVIVLPSQLLKYGAFQPAFSK